MLVSSVEWVKEKNQIRLLKKAGREREADRSTGQLNKAMAG